MASNSHSHAAGPRTRTRSKSVTAQQTLERVRNNQRRHRARRKDYIATLEQKLTQAEQSVTTLQSQVDALQAELARRRNYDDQTTSSCPVLPQQFQSDDGSSLPALLPSLRETSPQTFGLFPNTAGLENLPLIAPLPFQPLFSDDLSVGLGPELVDIFPHAEPENANSSTEFEIPQALIPLAQSPKHLSENTFATVPVLAGVGAECHSNLYSASDLALQTAQYQLTGGTGTLISAAATPDLIPPTAGTCCSDGHFSKPDDDKTDEHAIVLSQENLHSLPGFFFQPAIEAYYKYNTEGESTMLCAEAYILIAQQNFKGIDQKDVATWLWYGFRKPARRDEGCRVKTDLLFSLLAFISDT
ncbi:hypothetical protein B0O99DRAFT_154760 [Bisporella sp. PMI_857]|nr:hypothetical protein B0O99DRAFT_154760 [Bisporella sp. PMI_857]